MNLGSILGLGCLCRPFPAGVTNSGGGRQPRSIGLSTWTVHVEASPDILGNTYQMAAPSSPFVSWGSPRTVNERSDAAKALRAKVPCLLPIFTVSPRAVRVRHAGCWQNAAMTNTKAKHGVQPYTTREYFAEGGSNWSRSPRGNLDPQEVRCWGCAAAQPGAPCESRTLSGGCSFACAVRAARWRRMPGRRT